MADDTGPRRHATISDVARHAGVAPSTVSYALSGKRSVSEKVRKRIQQTIQELGYEPHAGARALASRRANVLALMMPLRSDMYIPILMEFAAAIVTEARLHDHDVLLLTREAEPDGLRRVASRSLADALIMMDVEQDDPRIPTLQRLGRPAVLIGVPEEHQDLVCTDLDWIAAGSAGVEHLAGLGHRSIGLLGQPAAVYERHTGFAERFSRGFAEAAGAHAVQVSARSCEATFPDVRAGLDALREALPDITALIVHNEAVIPLLLEELAARDVRVPQDLSILAVAPDSVAEQSRTPLTSVCIPVEEIGRSAVQLAMRQLDGESVEPTTLLPPRIVQRSSTAPPG